LVIISKRVKISFSYWFHKGHHKRQQTHGKQDVVEVMAAYEDAGKMRGQIGSYVGFY
jgi:hypothetical protein